jgi:hypothetical protein
VSATFDRHQVFFDAVPAHLVRGCFLANDAAVPAYRVSAAGKIRTGIYWRYELERGSANQDETRPPSSFSTALVLPPFFRSQRLWMQPRVSAVLTPTNSTEEPILATRKLRAALSALPLRRSHAPQLVLDARHATAASALYNTRDTNCSTRSSASDSAETPRTAETRCTDCSAGLSADTASPTERHPPLGYYVTNLFRGELAG